MFFFVSIETCTSNCNTSSQNDLTYAEMVARTSVSGAGWSSTTKAVQARVVAVVLHHKRLAFEKVHCWLPLLTAFLFQMEGLFWWSASFSGAAVLVCADHYQYLHAQKVFIDGILALLPAMGKSSHVAVSWRCPCRKEEIHLQSASSKTRSFHLSQDYKGASPCTGDDRW